MYIAVGAAPPRQGCFYNRCPGLVRKHKRLLSAQITFKLRKQTLESPDPAYADASAFASAFDSALAPIALLDSAPVALT